MRPFFRLADGVSVQAQRGGAPSDARSEHRPGLPSIGLCLGRRPGSRGRRAGRRARGGLRRGGPSRPADGRRATPRRHSARSDGARPPRIPDRRGIRGRAPPGPSRQPSGCRGRAHGPVGPRDPHAATARPCTPRARFCRESAQAVNSGSRTWTSERFGASERGAGALDIAARQRQQCSLGPESDGTTLTHDSRSCELPRSDASQWRPTPLSRALPSPEREGCHVAVTHRVAGDRGCRATRRLVPGWGLPAQPCTPPRTPRRGDLCVAGELGDAGRGRPMPFHARHVDVDHRQLEMQAPGDGGRRVLDAGEDGAARSAARAGSRTPIAGQTRRARLPRTPRPSRCARGSPASRRGRRAPRRRDRAAPSCLHGTAATASARVRRSTTRDVPRARRPLGTLELASARTGAPSRACGSGRRRGCHPSARATGPRGVRAGRAPAPRESLVGDDGLGGIEGERLAKMARRRRSSCSVSDSSE